jgi:hypothetical protein
MSRQKSKAHNQAVYASLIEMGHANPPDSDDDEEESGSQTPNNRMKKFRFQLFHEWLVAEIAPCRVADIGGGKGLLTYLLRKSHWQATVIDPVHQELPTKYKDIHTKKRILIPVSDKVPRINRVFNPAIAGRFDLLLGLHAHGCNIQIIDASAANDIGFVLMPCCVIDEPLYPVHGITWVQSLTDYAIRQGFQVRPFQLAFSGQSIGIYAARRS